MVQKLHFLLQVAVLSISLLIAGVGPIQAQSQNEMYQTRNGIINIVLPYHDSTITVHSKNLIVLLDYDNAYVEIELLFSKMHSGIDSIDTILKNIEGKSIKLNAKLGLSDINTHNHPPQRFHFEGFLVLNFEEIPITGEGHLQHLIGGESIDCRLGLNFELNPEIINYNHFHELNISQRNIQVNIVQSVLDRLK